MASDAQKVTAGLRHSADISPTPNAFRVAGLEINPQLATVRRGGETLEFRPKTYRVLLYLAKNPRRLVSKEELMAAVWEGAAVSDDVLVRCVADLRKAFQDDTKAPRILKTFPKMGYGLMADVEIVSGDAPAAGDAAPSAEAATGRRARARRLSLALAASLAAALIVWTGWRRSAGPAPENSAEAAWWRLDEGQGAAIGDSSVHRISGTLHGAAARNAAAPPSVVFRGADAVATGPARGLPAGDAPRSVNLWIKPAAPLVDAAGLFTYGSPARRATAGRFDVVLQLDGTVTFGASVPGSQLRSRRAITPGEWHMVTAVYEGPPSHHAVLLIDGDMDGETRFDPPPATEDDTTWQIGRTMLGGSFRGEVRDVRVYAEPLTAAKIRGLYRCSTGIEDLSHYYYAPVFGNDVVIESRGAGEPSSAVSNGGKDFAGVQFGRSDGACGLAALRGADAGQDLRFEMEIRNPSDAAGHVTEGGPYFRSRRAMAGDGLIGGASAGYWVELKSTGMLKVRRLNPQDVVAFSLPPAGFDASVYHRLAVEARGETLRVWLDGDVVEFEQAGVRGAAVRIPPYWKGPPAIGQNQGAAGVAFGAEENRGAIGGQRVRKLRITRLDGR